MSIPAKVRVVPCLVACAVSLGCGSYDDSGAPDPASWWPWVCADGGPASEAGCAPPPCADGGDAGPDAC